MRVGIRARDTLAAGTLISHNGLVIMWLYERAATKLPAPGVH
jgi:hypothetical protein